MYLANLMFYQSSMEVEADGTSQLVPPPARDDESRSGDAGLAETPRIQLVCNAQPLSTFVSPLTGAQQAPSPELQGTPLEQSESYPPVLADAGRRSAVPNPTSSLDHSHGLSESSATSRPDERSVSHVPRKPTPPILARAPRLPNQLELRVFPDKHCNTNDAHLKCTPYVVNVKYMVLICTDCRYCVNPDRALEHLRHDHPHCKVEITFSEHLNKRFPGLLSESIHPPETIEAVFGLAIPVEKYTVCSRCRRGYIDVPTWQRHVCRNADTDLAAGQRPHFSSHVQTFFRAPRICYFPVELPDSASEGTNGNDFELFTRNFQELVVSDGEIHEPDYRELNQFLQKEGWIGHVSGFSPSELSLLTGLTKDGEDLKSISCDVISLMTNIQTAIGTAGYHVRRLLGKRPA